MNIESEIKEFYGKLKFPGIYSIKDLEFYDEYVCNKYLKFFDDAMSTSSSVLDLGCGSGFITNFLARRHPDIKFTAVDFSDSIDYAKEFSKENNINNVKYLKTNILNLTSEEKFDCVLSNGVLHHIPEYDSAIRILKSLVKDNGQLALGVYNSYGKLLKKVFPINYTNTILALDQEAVPFEVTWSHSEFRNLFSEYNIKLAMPSIRNRFIDMVNLFNFKNGGLTVYLLKKSN